MNDYDYLQPPKNLRASKETSERYARALWEVYDYPGKYDKQDKGEYFAQIRLEAEQALDRRRNAGGDAPSLFAGGLVTLRKHPTSDENKEYLVVRASHHYGVQSYVSAGGGDGGGYDGTYQFLRSDRPFRMLPSTPKPRIHGIQTAKVVGNKGEDKEEISTDEHGHIWVQFYWDREPQKSCPIRVSQSWASKQWGEQFIPRLGMEVVVEFLEGDPDRPLVTGCVYNGDNKHPYKLPGLKTQSGLKSDSTKGHSGYNEFMFEDRKGNELVRMHAQKNHEVTVLHDEVWTIGNDRFTQVEKGDDILEIDKGDFMVVVASGSHDTHAHQEILVASDTTVKQVVISDTVTTHILEAGTIRMKAPIAVQIDAPFVIISGNLMVGGGIVWGPMSKPVT